MRLKDSYAELETSSVAMKLQLAFAKSKLDELEDDANTA